MKKKLLLGLLSLASLNAFANNNVLDEEFDKFYQEDKSGVYITTCFENECSNTYYDLNTNNIKGEQLEEISYNNIKIEKTENDFDWLTLDYTLKYTSNIKIPRTNTKRKIYKDESQKLRVTEDDKVYFEKETRDGLINGFLTVNQKVKS